MKFFVTRTRRAGVGAAAVQQVLKMQQERSEIAVMAENRAS